MLRNGDCILYPPPAPPRVVEHILAIRDAPPAQLQRVPGPRAIRSSLAQDAALLASGERLPRSTTTTWQVLRRHGRIARRPARAHEPLDPPPPMTRWQRDCKDVSSVPAALGGKRQHVVEARNGVDGGTSILVEAQVRDDCTEETTLAAVVGLHGGALPFAGYAALMRQEARPGSALAARAGGGLSPRPR